MNLVCLWEWWTRNPVPVSDQHSALLILNRWVFSSRLGNAGSGQFRSQRSFPAPYSSIKEHLTLQKSPIHLDIRDLANRDSRSADKPKTSCSHRQEQLCCSSRFPGKSTIWIKPRFLPTSPRTFNTYLKSSGADGNLVESCPCIYISYPDYEQSRAPIPQNAPLASTLQHFSNHHERPFCSTHTV